MLEARLWAGDNFLVVFRPKFEFLFLIFLMFMVWVVCLTVNLKWVSYWILNM